MKLIRKIMCSIGKHKYYLIKKIDSRTNQVGCKNCRKIWGMHHPTKSFVEWDDDLELMHFGEGNVVSNSFNGVNIGNGEIWKNGKRTI